MWFFAPNETICPTLKKIVYINMWFFAPNFGFCSSPLSSNNWIEHLQFCITVFLLTSTLHLLIINWFLWHDKESSYSWIGQIFNLYFFYLFLCEFCELRKEDRGYFYFNLVVSLLLKKKFIKNCCSSFSLRNYWMIALQFGVMIFLLFFTLHLFPILWFL